MADWKQPAVIYLNYWLLLLDIELAHTVRDSCPMCPEKLLSEIKLIEKIENMTR